MDPFDPRETMRSALAGYAAMAGLTIAAILAMWFWQTVSGSADRAAAVNETAILNRVYEITAYCAGETHDRCRGAMSAQSVEDYCLLAELGFLLPPYYRPGTPFEAESPC